MALTEAAAAVIVAGIGAVVNAVLQVGTNAQNKKLQEMSWDKMSIGQRVKELEENGLNKQLASGSAPNYSLQTSMKAPEVNTGKIADALFGLADNRRKQDLMAIQNEEFKHQKSLWEAEKKIIESQKDKAKYEADLAKYQSFLLAHDYKIFKERGITSKDTGLAREISNLASMIQNFMNDKGLKMPLDSIKEWLKEQGVKQELLNSLNVVDENNSNVSRKFTNNGKVRSGKRQLVFNVDDIYGAAQRVYEQASRGGYKYNGSNSRK